MHYDAPTEPSDLMKEITLNCPTPVLNVDNALL